MIVIVVQIPPNILLENMYVKDERDNNNDITIPFKILFNLKSTALINNPITTQLIKIDIKTVIFKSLAKSKNKQFITPAIIPDIISLIYFLQYLRTPKLTI